MTQSGGEQTQPRGFRPDIEGLRAIAILMVIAYHAGIPGFSGGYVGVDIFFVLSGYLITGLIVSEIEQTGTLNLIAFYARRARRLLPAMALVLLVIIVVSVAIYAPNEQVGFGTTAAATAAYASNWYFARAGTGYFHLDLQKNPLLHTWSLSVEEQFYLAWPVFVMLALGIFRWQKRPTNGRSRLIGWMAAAAALSFIVSHYLTFYRQPWAFFTSPPRAWEFAIGGIATLLPISWRLTAKTEDLLSWTGLAGILGAATLFGETTVFPGTAVLLPALATIALLRAATSRPNDPIVRFLGIQPLQAIGRLSYSWYLWHWPVLVLTSAIIDAPTLPLRIALMIISLGLAWLSYRLVEDPIRRSQKLAKRPAYSLTMAALIAVVGIALSLTWRQTSLLASRAPDQARFTAAPNDGTVFPNGEDCLVDFSEIEVRGCTFGPKDARLTVVLLGDSHAVQWFPAMHSISQQRNWRLVVVAKSACPPVDAPFFYGTVGRIYSECEAWRKNALRMIQQIRPAITVMTSSEGYSFQPSEWRDGIASVVDKVAASSQSVLILRDNPSPGFDVPICLARHAWRSAWIPSSSCQFVHPMTSDVYAFQQQASKRFRNVQVVDLSSNICPAGICPAEIGNIVIFRDTNHLTNSFVKNIESLVMQHIDRTLASNPVLGD